MVLSQPFSTYFLPPHVLFITDNDEHNPFQLAIPQLIPGAQFPYSFAGQPIPGYYIPQPIAQAAAQAAQSSYLQGLPGYPIGNFGASYPQGYIG